MSHRIAVSKPYRHRSTACRPGCELIETRLPALVAARDAIPEEFEVSGVTCIAGCDHPRPGGYHGTKKSTDLVGDVKADTDIGGLVAFASQFADLHDGWCSSSARPGEFCKFALARVPAAIMVTEETAMRLS